jgi:hypothetical protein
MPPHRGLDSSLSLSSKSLEPFEGGTRNAAEEIMTKHLFLCVVAFLITAIAHAQSTSPDPKGGAEMTGTITEYTPGTVLVLETLAPSEPVQFKLAKDVVYADADGKPIEAAGLTTNQKVRVHFTKIGGDNVADKVTLIGN